MGFPLSIASSLHKCPGKDEAGHESDEGSGVSGSNSDSGCGSEPGDSDADPSEPQPEPRPLVFGKKTSKTLQEFQGEVCPHAWRILDAVQDLTVEGNNVRMLPHAAFDMEWARSFSGGSKTSTKK